MESNKYDFNEFMNDFLDRALANEGNIVSRKPDLFHKIAEQRNKFARAEFDSGREKVREFADRGAERFMDKLSRWYDKHGERALATKEGRDAVFMNGFQPVEVLAYHRCKELLARCEAFNSQSENDKHKGRTQEAFLVEQSGKFKADEYALAYLFDLHASGKRVPTKKDGLDKEAIKLLAEERDPEHKPDSFYRSVKKLLRYDLNNPKYLNDISTRWEHVVKELSSDSERMIAYLTEKKLIDE